MVVIVWTKEADFDFSQILAYLSNSSPQYALSLFENVDDALADMKRFPKIGRRVPESDDDNDRELILQPYRLMYRYIEEEDKIYIITIIHGSRESFLRK